MEGSSACACEGHTLDRMLQPTVMSILAKSPAHGYAILERLEKSPMMRGTRPDAAGVYRLLAALEKQGHVQHRVTESEKGPAKRVYELTSTGTSCLLKWIDSLDKYARSLKELIEALRTGASGFSKETEKGFAGNSGQRRTGD